MNAMVMTADQILAIPVDRPEMIFGSANTYPEEYRQLAKIWHADVNPDKQAMSVIAHLNVLKDEAAKKVKAGKWERPGELNLKFASGGGAVFRYKRRIIFELGEFFYSPKKLGYLITPGFKDLMENGRSKLGGLVFRDGKMSGEMGKLLPANRHFSETEDGSEFLIMDKTPEVFLLDDVRLAMGGKIEPKHVAWIINGAYNLACYLRHIGMVHNGISASTLFISPQYHSVMLFGGWWYASTVGDRMKALPEFSRRVAPPDVMAKKAADFRTDLMCIKAIGRQLLGDVTGMTLLSAGVPDQIVSFLRLPSSGDAIKDYAGWGKALEASFDPRRFTEMHIKENDIYDLQKGA
jgi:hypothetical protein